MKAFAGLHINKLTVITCVSSFSLSKQANNNCVMYTPISRYELWLHNGSGRFKSSLRTVKVNNAADRCISVLIKIDKLGRKDLNNWVVQVLNEY